MLSRRTAWRVVPELNSIPARVDPPYHPLHATLHQYTEGGQKAEAEWLQISAETELQVPLHPPPHPLTPSPTPLAAADAYAPLHANRPRFHCRETGNLLMRCRRCELPLFLHF